MREERTLSFRQLQPTLSLDESRLPRRAKRG
jgi:hypothetical protein